MKKVTLWDQLRCAGRHHVNVDVISLSRCRCSRARVIWRYFSSRNLTSDIGRQKSHKINKWEKNEEGFAIVETSQGLPSYYISENVDEVIYYCVSQKIRSKESRKMKNKLKITPHCHITSLFLVCCHDCSCVSYERWCAQVPYCTNCTGIRVVGDLTHRLKCISWPLNSTS